MGYRLDGENHRAFGRKGWRKQTCWDKRTVCACRGNGSIGSKRRRESKLGAITNLYMLAWVPLQRTMNYSSLREQNNTQRAEEMREDAQEFYSLVPATHQDAILEFKWVKGSSAGDTPIFCVSCISDLLSYDIFEGRCTPCGWNLALLESPVLECPWVCKWIQRSLLKRNKWES